jgi:retinol dehydrogenase-14
MSSILHTLVQPSVLIKLTCIASVSVVVILRTLIRRRIRFFDFKTIRNSLQGVTVLITGATSGIGEAAAYEFAKHKARVILACRDYQRGQDIASDIEQLFGVKATVYQLDLGSLSSVQRFIQNVSSQESKIDILVNNGAVFKYGFSLSADDIEEQFAVNCLGHFYLTNKLFPILQASSGRIVFVSSALHTRGQLHLEDLNESKLYKGNAGYYNSKLALSIYAKELARRNQNSGVNVYCLHPGVVRTNLARHVKIPWIVRPFVSLLARIVLPSPLEGCQTILYCSLAPELAAETGKYYGYCRKEDWSKAVLSNERYAEALWNFSNALIDAKCK